MKLTIIQKIIGASLFVGATSAAIATPIIIKQIENAKEEKIANAKKTSDENDVRFYVYLDSTSTTGQFDKNNYWCKHKRRFFDCKISEVVLDENKGSVQEARKLKTTEFDTFTNSSGKKRIFEVRFDGTKMAISNLNKTENHTQWVRTDKEKNATVDIYTKDTKTGNAHVSLKPMFSWFQDDKKVNADHFIVWLEDMDENINLNDRYFKCQLNTKGTTRTGVACQIYAFNQQDNARKDDSKEQNYKKVTFNSTAINNLISKKTKDGQKIIIEKAKNKLKKGNFYIISFKTDKKMSDLIIDGSQFSALPKYIYYFKGKVNEKRLSFRVWERVFYDKDISEHMFVDMATAKNVWYDNEHKEVTK